MIILYRDSQILYPQSIDNEYRDWGKPFGIRLDWHCFFYEICCLHNKMDSFSWMGLSIEYQSKNCLPLVCIIVLRLGIVMHSPICWNSAQVKTSAVTSAGAKDFLFFCRLYNPNNLNIRLRLLFYRCPVTIGKDEVYSWVYVTYSANPESCWVRQKTCIKLLRSLRN